jgi:acyltransferase
MSAKSERIFFIDAAKALGIFLVFYGHIIEKFYSVGSEVAFPQYKFIFSFHMPLFFIIAGFFFKVRSQSKSLEIKRTVFSRLIPVLFWGIVALPLWPLYRYLILGYVDIPIFEEKILPYLKGHPELNQITWFLVCLFTTEVIAIFILPKVKKTISGLLLAGFFLGAGLFLTSDMKQAELLLGIYKNTWYIHEALVAFGLYTLGYILFDPIKSVLNSSPLIRLFLLVISLGVTLLTFNFNEPYQDFFVVMKDSWHGNSAYFLLTALSGTFFILLLSTFVPNSKAIDFIGQNTLILLGTNGIFHDFINIHVVTKIKNINDVFVITVASGLFSIFSILLSGPIIWLLNKYFPQLVGKPHQDGPILPNFIK